MLDRVAIAVLAGIPLSAVLVRIQLYSRKSRSWEPGFSWRIIAATYVFMAGAGAQSYGETQTLVWRHQHLSFKALLLADAAAGALYIWHWFYCRRLRGRAESGAEAAVN